MADKILKTKIALLYKTYEEWEEIKSTYKPLKGEVCFCGVPASSESKNSVLFKVGNGEDTFEDLPWASALAADVFEWAKKESLDFNDLSNDFLTELDKYIQEQSGGLTYRILDKGDNLWQLQQKAKDKEWEDVKDSTVDLSNTLKEIDDKLNEKVDIEVSSSEATTTVVNDGVKAGLTISDGENKAFVGVEGGKAHYLKGTEVASADTELVTKADIKDLEGALKFIGATNRLVNSQGEPIETVEEAIARLLEEKGIDEPKAGDVVLIDSAEYVYDGEVWKEIGDEGTYATKAALEEEIERAQTEELVLDNRIDDLEADLTALEEKLPFNSEGRLADLDPIAYDGLVNNLKQNDGEYLILDCNAE